MILVLSTDYYEQGTDPVVAYLARENIPFIRLSVQDLVGGRPRLWVDVQQGAIWIDGIELTRVVHVVWYRRLSNGKHFNAHIGEPDAILDGLQDEVKEILDFIFYLLRDKLWLPNYAATHLNKLTLLHKATEHDVLTPDARLFTRREDLQDFFLTHSSVITKPVSHNVFYISENQMYVSFSKQLSEEEISFLAKDFHTSLFQRFIIAEHELRVFYLDGEFYTVAAIPQNGESMFDDIKIARMEKKVRYQSFMLPSDEQKRLGSLMRTMDINICTMDILYSKSMYYLIDVNPFGQYLFESQLGNLHLEKRIADWLIKKDKALVK